jgi:hypothetical protein
MTGSLLEAAVTKWGFDAVEGMVRWATSDIPTPSETVKSIKEAIDRAADSFHERHGSRYGGKNNSFLVRKENVETIIRSTLPGNGPLSGEDLNGEGFEGAEEAPVEVRKEFVELFHEEMRRDRHLGEILERQEQKRKADRRREKLLDEVETIRQAIEEQEWFGEAVGEGPRSNYLQYLQNIASRFEENAHSVALDVVPGGKERRREAGSEEYAEERRKLRDVLEGREALLLTGPPGSGKSVMIEQHLWRMAIEAAAGPIGEKGFCKGQTPIPIYVIPGRGDIFKRIAHALHRDGLGDQTFSEDWVRQALNSGNFFLAVDDANRFARNGLSDILDYRSSTQIVLVSRDRSNIPREATTHCHVAPLTEKQAKVVLRPALGEETNAFYHRTQHDERLRALARRPQTLLLLASSRTENLWIPQDRYGLYEKAFKSRHRKEEPREDLLDEAWFKRRLLRGLALDTAESSKSYVLPRPEAHKSVNHTFQRLGEEGYDPGSISASGALDTLQRQGHLVGDGEVCRFEHDRWLEFFAARELVEREASLGIIAGEETRREIAFFAGALSTIESEIRDKPEFWVDFWERVALLDPFWALVCRDQRTSRYRHEDENSLAVQNCQRILDEIPDPTEAEIEEAYDAYAEVYERLRDTHFPKMAEIFPPHTDGRVGVLVEREPNESAVLGEAHWHGFVEVGSGAPRARLVDELEYTYHDDGGTTPSGIRASPADPARGTPPAVAALKRLADPLEKALENDQLWEPAPLLQERAYFEAVALHRANLDSSRTAVPSSIDPDKLRRELEQISFVSKGELESSKRLGRGRKVSYSEWLETLDEAKRRGISIQPLIPPIPPPWTVIPKCDGQPLSDPEIEKLTEWSVEYYETMYRVLFELIEKGFPTTKQRFRCFADRFPVLVVLALGDRSEGQVRRPKNELSRARLGVVWTIQRRDSPEERIKVVTVEDDSKARELAEEKGTMEVWETGWSVWFRPSIPPLQHGVYREVRDDLEKLLQGKRPRLR